MRLLLSRACHLLGCCQVCSSLMHGGLHDFRSY